MKLEDHFHAVADRITALLHADEVHLSNFHGERSDFVRLNQGKIRQAGSVEMRSITVDLVRGRRHASGSVTLSGDLETDDDRLRSLIGDLRATLAHVPDDPFLLYATEPRSSVRRGENRLPEAAAAVDEIRRLAAGLDLVGIYASGGVHSGFANSLGQRNWHESYSYNADWSLYHRDDKAVAENYAGFEWRSDELERRMALAVERLRTLARAARRIEPGGFRAYLAPAALAEVLGLLGWGGFGLRAHRTKTTPLLRMIEEGARLDSRVTLLESARGGLAPDFQEEGFRRADEVPLVERGVYRDCLASPRSAAEYGVPTNGASSSEMPQSLALRPGEIATDDVLSRLGTGIYLGNVWYLNYSDRAACRITGLTRFATFWVEDGALREPLEVMRFDDTIYRILGENLIGLTREAELIVDPSTYGRRSTASSRLPGALVDDFRLTL